jgi:hypothetical protein
MALEPCLLGPPPNINIHTYINININNTLDIKRLQSENRKMIASKIAMIHKLEMLQIFLIIARHTVCSIRRNRFVEVGWDGEDHAIWILWMRYRNTPAAQTKEDCFTIVAGKKKKDKANHRSY